MIQAMVGYWESQKRAIIEEYSRENVETETEAEAIMREKSEGIERVRAEYKSKTRAEYDMRKKYGGEGPLVLKILETDKPIRGGSILIRKLW